MAAGDSWTRLSEMTSREGRVRELIRKYNSTGKLSLSRGLDPAEKRSRLKGLRTELATLNDQSTAMRGRLQATQAAQIFAPRSSSPAAGRSSGS